MPHSAPSNQTAPIPSHDESTTAPVLSDTSSVSLIDVLSDDNDDDDDDDDTDNGGENNDETSAALLFGCRRRFLLGVQCLVTTLIHGKQEQCKTYRLLFKVSCYQCFHTLLRVFVLSGKHGPFASLCRYAGRTVERHAIHHKVRLIVRPPGLHRILVLKPRYHHNNQNSM